MMRPMRPRATRLVAIAMCAPAIVFGCADVLGVRDLVYVPEEGGVQDGGDGAAQDGDAGAFDAGEGGACTMCAGADGAPCAIACNETSPRMIAVDGKTVVWLASTASLRAATLPAPQPVTIATVSPPPTALFTFTGQIVWSDGASVRSAWLGDGGVRTLVTDAGAATTIAGPVLASSFPAQVYFGTPSTIMRCPLPDCTPPLLQVGGRNGVTGLVSTLQASPNAPYGFWIDKADPNRLVVGAELVGGVTVKTWSTQGTATGVLGASDSTNVYYATFANGQSQVWKLGAGSPSLATAGNVTGIAVVGADALVAIDDTSAPATGKVVKVLGAGGLQTIAANQDRPSSVAVDETYVYWTTLGGTVMRAAR